MQEVKRDILAALSTKGIKFEVHDFSSGCSMIDVWKESDFYIIQVEPDSIGMSLIKVPDFSTIPDERFYDAKKFLEKLNNLLNE